MKRFQSFLFSTLLCTTLLAGCQSAPAGPETTTSPTTAAPVTTPSATTQPEALRTQINVATDWGITPGQGYGMQNALILADKLASLPDHSDVLFPEGEYELAFPMYLTGKRSISLLGTNVTIVRTHVSNQVARQGELTDAAIPEDVRPNTASSSALVIKDCHSVTAEGFTFRYAVPTSLSGTVIERQGNSLTLQIDDTTDFTGDEYAAIINTFTEEGVPDKTLEQYATANFPLEKLSDNTLRVDGLDAAGVDRVKKGTRVSLRLATGNDYVINLSASTDVSFQSLTMYNSLNGGIIVRGRCKDLSLTGIAVKPENEKSLFSLNADILHIASLEGSLTVDSCHFERPGDDCINIHHMAYEVESINGTTATIRAPRYSGDKTWAKAGDAIDFYDPATFALLGSAKITKVEENQYTFDALPTGICEGAIIANDALRPQATIQNVTVLSNRARGFLLQTDTVLVENCTFKDTALAAILLAPDVEYWYEMSPAANITIQNNTFENCGKYAPGILQITTSHDDPNKTYPSYIHQNISVTKNNFIRGNQCALFGICVDTLTFRENTFTSNRYNQVVLNICKNVTLDEKTLKNSTLTDIAE